MQNNNLNYLTKSKVDNIFEALNIKPSTLKIIAVMKKVMLLMKMSSISPLGLPQCSSLHAFSALSTGHFSTHSEFCSVLIVASCLATWCLFYILCIWFQSGQWIFIFFIVQYHHFLSCSESFFFLLFSFVSCLLFNFFFFFFNCFVSIKSISSVG